MEKFEQALELFKKVPEGLPYDIARTLRSIGDIYGLQGNHDKALEKFEKALELFKKVEGDFSNVDVARTLRRIGEIRAMQGKHNQALEKFGEALEELFKEVPEGLPYDIARTLRSIGDVYVMQGNHDQALEKFEKALELFKEVPEGLPYDIARTLRSIGDINVMQGNHGQALEKFEKALELFKKVPGGFRLDIARTLRSIGDNYEMQGEHNQALEKFGEALELFKEVHKEVPGNFEILWLIGDIYEQQGEYSQAVEQFRLALKTLRQNGYSSGIVAIVLQKICACNPTDDELEQVQEYLKNDINVLQNDSSNEHSFGSLNYHWRTFEGLMKYANTNKEYPFLKSIVDEEVSMLKTINDKIPLVKDKCTKIIQQMLNFSWKNPDKQTMSKYQSQLISETRDLEWINLHKLEESSKSKTPLSITIQ